MILYLPTRLDWIDCNMHGLFYRFYFCKPVVIYRGRASARHQLLLSCSAHRISSLLAVNEFQPSVLHTEYCKVMACFLPSSRAPGPIRLDDSLSNLDIAEKSISLEFPTYDALDGSEELEQRLQAVKNEIQDAKVDW